ncbi:DUF1998 domain-containing protein [Candidatus Poseidonia alphae]|nr:DUF1998 domain-containing protein [Candidatus Poseidonia alphae]MDB2637217.1 DUF1998 domain-containing protein [Candidatus Poseidonia alphae]
MSEEDKLLEFLSRNHYLPSFNLPIDAVPFIARTTLDGEERIEARMSDGLEKALHGYAPGAELTYKKKEFVVGGIFLEYMPRKPIDEDEDPLEKSKTRTNEVINRTRYWFSLQKNIKFFHMCKVCKNTLQFDSTLPEDVEALSNNCKVCDSKPENWQTFPAIIPPGFGPLIRPATGRSGFSTVADPDYTRESRRMFTRTRWPTALINDDSAVSKSKDLASKEDQWTLQLTYQENVDIVNINAGYGNMDEDQEMGFAFCKKCGHMTPGKRLPSSRHLRPYAITRKDGMYSGAYSNDDLKSDFESAMNGKCEHSADETMIHGKSRLLLARKFTTNIMSLKIRWDNQHWVNLKEEQETGERAAQTLCQGLLQAICNADTEFAISPNDIGGDIRQMEQPDQGFEIFIFERVDGGAGLLKEVYNRIDKDWNGSEDRGVIFEKLNDILAGDLCIDMITDEGKRHTIAQPCDQICNGCLQDFTTQHMSGELNRELGYHMLEMTLQNTNHKPNFHNDAKNLADLVQEVNERRPKEKLYDINPIYEPGHVMFHNKSGEQMSAELEARRTKPHRGVKIGGLELTVISDLLKPTDDTKFPPSMINERPIELMELIKKKLDTQELLDSSNFSDVQF